LDGQDRKECCLLCGPFGQEAVRSHRVFRIIADRLAHSGFHVLRFDYFGTGDSAGEDDEGNLDRWTDDLLRANDELIRRSGCARSSWFGLRLGASIAALASRKATGTARRLILWDPVVQGPAYLDELSRAHIAARRESFEAQWERDSELRARVAGEAVNQILGYPLTEELKTQVGALSLSSFAGLNAEHVTLVSANLSGELARLQEQMASSGVDVRTRKLEMDINWTTNEMLNDSLMPPQDLRSIASAFMEA
jgi:exosortase A-associated hydrolase 2